MESSIPYGEFFSCAAAKVPFRGFRGGDLGVKVTKNNNNISNY